MAQTALQRRLPTRLQAVLTRKAHRTPSFGGTGQKRHGSPFWRHFFEMLAAMVTGMLVTGAIFVSVVGLKTWDEVTVQYPAQALLAMAAGMTIPMVAWMLCRGYGTQERL
jgi:hypothetical protein